MKKVFSLLIVMAFVFSAAAQDANADKPKKVKEPEITFESLVHDYGEIMQGDNGTCEFVFKNTGKADLILTNCRSSCGCTVPEWPKDPIAPGKKAVIKVKYNTNRIGIINFTDVSGVAVVIHNFFRVIPHNLFSIRSYSISKKVFFK